MLRQPTFFQIPASPDTPESVFRQFLFIARSNLKRLLCVTALLSANWTAEASAAEFRILEVGFQGVAKVGRWVPVSVTATGLPTGAEVELRAAFSDPRGDTCVEIVDRGPVDAAGSVSLSGYFKPGRLEGFGQVQIVHGETQDVLCRQVISHGGSVAGWDPDSSVHSTLKLHQLDVPFLMTIGEVAGIPELLRNANNFSDGHALLQGVTLSSIEQLPQIADGLDAIDCLLLTDRFQTSVDQARAVQQWVRRGGRLFVSSGGTVAELVNSEIGGWLQSRFGIGPEPIRVLDLSAMQSFVRGATVLQTNREAVEMAVLTSDQTVDDVTSLDGTVLGTQSVGAGTVTIVAVDLNRRPVSRWRSLPEFYEVLLFGRRFSEQTTRESRTSRISQSGVSDLATQMMATVDAIPETGRWSTWGVMGLIAGFLLLIGPVDYLLVTNVLKRPHLTWLTFPVLLTAAAAVLFAAVGTRGTAVLNQFHLIDVVPNHDGSHVQTQSWMSVSSPQTMRADLTAAPGFTAAGSDSEVAPGETQLTWSGRPEDIFGGMYRVGGIGLGRQSYLRDSRHPATLTGVPMLTNGSRELYAQWQQSTPQPIVNSRMSVSGYGLLNGQFSHTLPFAITDWTVMYGNRVYRSRRATGEDRLSAEDVWDSKSDDIYASDLKSFLNASRLVQSDRKKDGNRGATQVVTPYDRQSRDPFYIMTTATFYETAGAAEYVGLSNSLLTGRELSDTIRLNHAVLIGTAEESATTLTLNDASLPIARSKTIVRLLIPINRRPSQGLAPLKDSNKD
ncbi:MAG: hypothetical protein R3C59_12260 [Planctomycetaceae bacterium]